MIRNVKRAVGLVTLVMIVSDVSASPSMQQPWQRSVKGNGYQSRTQQYRRHVAPPDISSHFLDDPDWMTDKRNRPWNPQANRRRPNQYSWTSRLVVANAAVYVAQMINPRVTSWGIKISDRILRGEQMYRLLSPVFLHGSIIHILVNMSSLRNVGPNAENYFGSGRFLGTYLMSGIAGNYLSALQSPNPALGASGAIAGIVAGVYVFVNRHDWLFGRQGKAISDSIVQSALMTAMIGVVNPQVDNWGHLGGAIGGAAMAYYFGPRLYLAAVPGGGHTVIDRPILRLPRPIEAAPQRVSETATRIARRLKVWRYRSELPDKPWRPKDSWNKINYQRRRDTPNKSIKPKISDEF